MDFLGNISLKLVGLLCTVGVMAAAYFFFVKPALDTTTNAIDSFATPLQQVQEDVSQATSELQQQSQQPQPGAATGNPNPQQDLARLQSCVQKAGQNVNRLQACANKFGP